MEKISILPEGKDVLMHQIPKEQEEPEKEKKEEKEET